MARKIFDKDSFLGRKIIGGKIFSPKFTGGLFLQRDSIRCLQPGKIGPDDLVALDRDPDDLVALGQSGSFFSTSSRTFFPERSRQLPTTRLNGSR